MNNSVSKTNSFQLSILYPALSALAFVLSLFYFLPWLALVAFVPLLYSLDKATNKRTLIRAGVFALIYTLFLFSWMINSSVLSTGETFYGYLATFVSVAIFTSAYSLLFYLSKKLSKSLSSHRRIYITASVFTLFEFICDTIFKNLPFYNPHFGNPLLGSTYSIQLAELGGIYILSFFVLLSNGYINYVVQHPAKIKTALYIAGAFLVVNLSLYSFRSVDAVESRQVQINLLNPNILPHTNWEENGNALIQNLLVLNKHAAAIPSDFNVWTESVVPWTYSKDDDFVKAILNEKVQAGTLTVLGMNTDLTKNVVYNSAYVLNADQTVAGRYDKVNPLSFIESPFTEDLPMVGDWGFTVKPGTNNSIIDTRKGRVGVFICNEASIASTAALLVKNGAHFLINISNDGWFKDTYLVKQHFYASRLRAVETRRDIAINNNCGYSGKASADGDIEINEQSTRPSLMQISLTRRNDSTFYSHYPGIILLLMLLLFTLIFFK